MLDGNICALQAAKDHVNIFLYDGAIVPDPEGIITGGYGNKSARTVAVRQGEMINARALTAMFQHIVLHRSASVGWTASTGWMSLPAKGIGAAVANALRGTPRLN